MTTLTRTARLTGLAYLGLAISGMLAFLLIRQQLYVPDDAVATASNLVEQASLARLGVAMDLTVVLTQSLAALWFFKLFRGVDSFAAGAIATFGLVNAVLILIATVFSATALEIALAGSDGTATAQLLYQLSGAAWSLGGLFFGLWLIPMGLLVVRSGWLPRSLGQLLMGGGVGYVLSTFVSYVFADADLVAGLLTVPATIGELWIVGYLILFGVREHARPDRESARVTT